jgi:hypothetical protein
MRKGIYTSMILAALVAASLTATPAVAQQQARTSLALPSSTDTYDLLNCYPSSTTWSTLAQTKSGGHYYSFVARTCLYWDDGLQRMKSKTMVRSRRDGDPWYAYSINGDTVTVYGFTRPCSVCSWEWRVRTSGWADQGGTGRDFTSGPWCTPGSNNYLGVAYHLRIAWTSSLVSNEHEHGSWETGPINTLC